MDNKYQTSRSRLPRMNVSATAGSDCRRSGDSSIPRPQKAVNNVINNKLNVCPKEEQKISNDCSKHNRSLYTKMDSFDGNYDQRVDTSCGKTTSLCKSQSLNEIQYQKGDKRGESVSKLNLLSNGCDSHKAFSFERLDENYKTFDTNPSNLTKDMISDQNLMDMSIDESSTASLGLLPNIMSSEMSPFDNYNQNIPFISTENDFIYNKNIEVIKNGSFSENERTEGDDDSETGIPVIQEEESDADMTITNALESNDWNNSSDNNMESICSVVNEEMAEELETMNLDNCLTLKSNTDNESNNDMSIESTAENSDNYNNCNTSETNIPLNNEIMINRNNENNDLNNISKALTKPNINSNTSIDKSFNERTNDCNKIGVKPIKSSAIRPKSLSTSSQSTKDPNLTIGTEKVQRSASPSAKAPLRKRIKTPGRWDAVMNKIEKSKTSCVQNNNKTVIKGKTNSNISRNVVPNGSLSRISPSIGPSDQLSVANDSTSSHSNPSTPLVSIKPNITSSNVRKNTLNSNATKVTIPKSKTFVRDSTANQSTGSKSQQPVPPILATTPVTPQPVTSQPVTSQPVTEKSESQTTIRRDRGVVTVNDKKTSNRRSTQTNTTGSSFAAKRMTNTKINSSNANCAKRDVRSVQSSDDKQEIQRLTKLCETKTKQMKCLGLDQNYIRLAFDSLSVVVQHLIEQYEPFESPKLKRALKNANYRCEQLKHNLDEKDIELNDMKIIFEEQINQLMKEREKNYSDLNQAKVSHEFNIKRLKEMHSSEVKRIEDKHNRELEFSQQNVKQFVNEIEEKNNELIETKQLKDDLQVRVKQMEENIMNDKDKRFKYLTEKSKQLELEVESLKVVMDMKNEKIHILERKMIETQEKMNELPSAKDLVKSLQQQTETLQITLDRKIHAFNALTREHEDLKCLYEKEMREKRRLSMKNEELVFHLSESFNESVSGLNSCTNFDPSHHRFKSPAINIDETPIKTNMRSMNMNMNSNNSSVRKSHSKLNRSVSTSTSVSNSMSNPSVNMRHNPPFHRFPSSSSSCTENHTSDDVFERRSPHNDCNRVLESNKKSVKTCERFAISDETPPQCILDSGFEEIQGLNSLPNK